MTPRAGREQRPLWKWREDLEMTTLNLVTLVTGQEQGARAKVVTLQAQNM